MITNISLNNVASYKRVTTLTTDKKVNLIYGLNGTGKSTLSNFLYKPGDNEFKDCVIQGLNESHRVLVYNQKFIRENFFESEKLPGIFSLAKENKDAVTKIDLAQKEIEKLEGEKNLKNKALNDEMTSLEQKLEKARNVVWEIKTAYSGGDRVMEFCLDGYKGSKEALFTHICSINKPAEKPEKDIEQLKAELQSISGENAQRYSELPAISFAASYVESDTIFDKQIIGNQNSTVADLIKKLANSDWVKAGLSYLPAEPIEKNEACPFCQEATISSSLIDGIKGYFDASYEADIVALKLLLSKYETAIQALPGMEVYEVSPKFEAVSKDFEITHTAFTRITRDNKRKIDAKLQTPSVPVILEDSGAALRDVNQVIQQINNLITEHNQSIDQIAAVKNIMKATFWKIMRWKYDQTIQSIIAENRESKVKKEKLSADVEELARKISAQRALVAEQQKYTVNIDEAIANINHGLLDLGISDFKIENHAESLYKIVRDENASYVFRSLSEGEKMIISFLYFIELCRGKTNSAENDKKKIIIIDDPISSLSHVYVFNIGRLIKSEFLGKRESKKDKVTGETVVTWKYKYEQLFVLTHSLYFFYELTETNHDYRPESQKLFRLSKNNEGSAITEMKYQEISNDYQAYWYVVKDSAQPPALIANCMRNIIEYFFNFVEKKELSAFFGQAPLSSNKYQAFYRYINRESHSLGQNIFDFKEFDYYDFKTAFAELFKVAGYEDHYKKMLG